MSNPADVLSQTQFELAAAKSRIEDLERQLAQYQLNAAVEDQVRRNLVEQG